MTLVQAPESHLVRYVGPRHVVAPLVIGFLALALIVVATFWLNKQTQTVFNEVNAARIVRTEAVELRNALQSAESSQRGYLYTNNEVYLAPYDVAKTQALKQMQLVQGGLGTYPYLEAAGTRLADVVEQKIEEMDQTIALMHERKEGDALALVQTNRGKALMDEAYVYLSGIIRAADQRVVNLVADQQRSAARLRLISIVGALIILAMAISVAMLVRNYTRTLTAAQREVLLLNAELEERVRARTDDLSHSNEQLLVARDQAEALLTEVNHRVANSLAMVSTMVKMQANLMTDKGAKTALADTRDRIYAVSLVHRKLYSTGDVRFVSLDDYLAGLLANIQSSIQNDQLAIRIKSDIAAIKMPIDLSISLGVILNEWVSNALKYAYPDGKGDIRIELKVVGDNKAQLTVADDGVGYDTREKPQGTGFGTKIVGAMAISLGAEIEYKPGAPGTTAILTFPLQQFASEPKSKAAGISEKRQNAF
jgi:two-component sensor histidine kinase